MKRKRMIETLETWKE